MINDLKTTTKRNVIFNDDQVRIWEFQSIVDSPKLAPIHIWIKLVSMCGTLFGICRIIFLGVENDTLSCLGLLKAAGNMFSSSQLPPLFWLSRVFVVLQYLVYPTLCLLCKALHSLLTVDQSQNTTVGILSESEHNRGHAAVCERSARRGTRSTAPHWGEMRSLSRNFSTA